MLIETNYIDSWEVGTAEGLFWKRVKTARQAEDREATKSALSVVKQSCSGLCSSNPMHKVRSLIVSHVGFELAQALA